MAETDTAAKSASPLLVRWAWGLLILFPVVVLTLVFLVAKGGRLVPIPYMLMINDSIMFLVLWFILRRGGWRWGDIGWRFGNWRQVALDVLVGVAGGALFYWLDEAAIGPAVEKICGALHWTYPGLARVHPQPSPMLFAAMIVTSTLFAGTVEESIYRGYAITALRQRLGTAVAALVTSAFFGVLHLGFFGAIGMVANFFDGLLLASLFLSRRRVLPAAIAHAVANVIGLFT
jgi:membrane protease YdiL (CAAX protease family)